MEGPLQGFLKQKQQEEIKEEPDVDDVLLETDERLTEMKFVNDDAAISDSKIERALEIRRW